LIFISVTFGFSQEENEEEEDSASQLLSTFATACAQLRSLCWVDRLEPAFTSVLYEKLEIHIREVCEDEYEEPLLSQLDDWMEKVALPWLKTVHHAPTSSSSSSLSSSFSSSLEQQEQHGAHKSWTKRLYFHMYTTFGNLRIGELFNIIKDYPNSEPAIVDLRSCLKRTHQHRHLTKSLREAFDCRLLHPGAETNSILG
jgi:anaphase-promoting complex subunit 2